MKITKAILLAGGAGTRLRPFSNFTNKHLLPLYNKPIIYYPLANIMQAGIREIMLISGSEFISAYKKLLGDGAKYGISIRYKIQSKPLGLPQAFILGENFIKKSPVCLNLGDHILYGDGLNNTLSKIVNNFKKTTILSAKTNFVNDSGVPFYNKKGNLKKIIEKPKKTKIKRIICGLYFYDSEVVNRTKKLKTSFRNEYEITDLNNSYIKDQKLNIIKLNSKIFWHDAGDVLKIHNASKKIEKYEKSKGQVGCIEKIALDKKFITKREYFNLLDSSSDYYSNYLKSIV